jgi:hypothetical protein
MFDTNALASIQSDRFALDFRALAWEVSLQRFRQHPQVVITELDGTLSLFQSTTCDYLTLNETASSIWQALGDHPTVDDLCATLQQQYDVEAVLCRRELEAWLNEALSKQIVIASDT